MLNLLANWRMMLWIGLHVVLIVGSFLPQTGELLAGWWNEQQNAGPVRWRVTLSWPNNPSVLVSAVMEVESLVAGRAGSGESVGTAAQSSGYHHRPTA